MSRDALPVSAAIATALILTGCASNRPLPDSQLDTAEAAITEAEAAGARATAPKLVNRADGKVNEARRLIEQEEYARAERLLEQATADARLAGEQARTAKAKQAVRELEEAIHRLENRMMKEQT